MQLHTILVKQRAFLMIWFMPSSSEFQIPVRTIKRCYPSPGMFDQMTKRCWPVNALLGALNWIMRLLEQR